MYKIGYFKMSEKATEQKLSIIYFLLPFMVTFFQNVLKYIKYIVFNPFKQINHNIIIIERIYDLKEAY